MFEYVYLARPDSVMDGISVYQARLNMGETLAKRVISTVPPNEIDVVIPIPESSRPSAMQLAQMLGKPYREGFVKNRYVGRTFIMPGQAVRKKSVRQKLNAIASEFKGRNVLLVDDSIVRGTTSQEIVQMARDAGAARSTWPAPPPVRYPNVYGIDMPTREELVAHGRSIEEMRQIIGADALIYQDVEAMKQAVPAQPARDALRGLVLRRRVRHRRHLRGRPGAPERRAPARAGRARQCRLMDEWTMNPNELNEQDLPEGLHPDTLAVRVDPRAAATASTPRRCTSPAASCSPTPPPRRAALP
jgi:adenine/guanine phosphoribosyltransferase-like PRPP-binding protein